MPAAPSIQISEVNIGLRPVTAVQLNTIGLVGKFNWGPVNVATLIQSASDLKKQFGPTYETTLSGRISGDAIFAQNPRATVWVVRIAPTSVAAVKATVTLNTFLRIDAKNTGTEGNNIFYTVAAGTTSGKKYTITDAVLGATEVWDNIDISGSLDNTAAVGGPNEPGKGSVLVSFTKLLAGVPSNVGPVALPGGTNGTAVDADYIGAAGTPNTGLYAFNGVHDVRYLVVAQQSSTTINTAVQTYAASRAVGDGLVYGILNTPSGQDPATVSIGSLDTFRAGMFWPWVKSNAVPLLEQSNWVAPDGFVAGLKSTLNPNQAAGNKLLQGVLDLQYAAIDTQVDLLSNKRVNAITAVRNRGIRVRDDVTLSSDSAWVDAPIRNEYDTVEETTFDATAWVLDEPNIPDVLWPQVAAQLDEVLRGFKADGTIVGFLPTEVSVNNNPPADVAAGKLHADMRVAFTYPAKYLTISIDRVLSV